MKSKLRCKTKGRADNFRATSRDRKEAGQIVCVEKRSRRERKK